MSDSADQLRTIVQFPDAVKQGALPVGCRVQVDHLAAYLEWNAADCIFGAFKPASPKEVVYFIGGDTGPVKIGITTNAEQRLESLQTGCPVRLSVLAIVPAGRSLERAYHAYFADYRLHGEWFVRSPDLEREIQYWSAARRRHNLGHTSPQGRAGCGGGW